MVNGSFIFGWLLGPLAIMWVNAVRFGVVVEAAPGCAASRTPQGYEQERPAAHVDRFCRSRTPLLQATWLAFSVVTQPRIIQ